MDLESVLPSLEDLYPYAVTVKHKGQPLQVSLAIIAALESHAIMNNVDFILDFNADVEWVAFCFKAKKNAKWLKERKKDIRQVALYDKD